MKFMGRAARMARHHKRDKAEGEINLVSMIDMLTVLVFFLLVYSSHEIEILPSAKDVQLPQSMAEQSGARRRRRDHLGNRDPHERARASARSRISWRAKSSIIPALKSALENQVERVLTDTSAQTEEERIASREVTIMADKEIPYQLLKRVMATSTAADYGQLSLAVLQKASEARLATVARN